MPESSLAGVGVLVTRPSRQARDLIDAVEAAGGRAICFPVLEISPRNPQDVEAQLFGRDEPDIVVYVSRNAVEHGLAWTTGGAIAAVGPATAAAIEAAGRVVDIRPAEGFDSESLLREPALTDVRGRIVRIVRGKGGRELLAHTLRQRGAHVDYLEVYTRGIPDYDKAEIARIVKQFEDGDINVVTIMSVESLTNLLSLLPDAGKAQLARTPLVTPSARVIKEVTERLPGCPTTLAAGTGADEMVRAIATLGPHESGQNS